MLIAAISSSSSPALLNPAQLAPQSSRTASSSSTSLSSSPVPSSTSASSGSAGGGATATSSSSHGGGGSASATAASTVSTLVGTYSTTVGDKQYSGSVEEENGVYTASVPSVSGATATGGSAMAAENNLSSRIDELV